MCFSWPSGYTHQHALCSPTPFQERAGSMQSAAACRAAYAANDAAKANTSAGTDDRPLSPPFAAVVDQAEVADAVVARSPREQTVRAAGSRHRRPRTPTPD